MDGSPGGRGPWHGGVGGRALAVPVVVSRVVLPQVAQLRRHSAAGWHGTPPRLGLTRFFA